MLLRDTKDRSSLQSHSLLNHLYGVSDARTGVVASYAVVAGQFLNLTCNSSAAPADPLESLPGYYNGCVLTMLTGPAKGYSTRIVGYAPASRAPFA